MRAPLVARRLGPGSCRGSFECCGQRDQLHLTEPRQEKVLEQLDITAARNRPAIQVFATLLDTRPAETSEAAERTLEP